MFLCGSGWNGCVVGCNMVGGGLVDFGVMAQELILLMDGVFGWNWVVQKNEVLVELFVYWV